MPRRRKPAAKPLGRNYIAAWRVKRDKTQAELAEYIGISESHLSRIERGQKEYNQSILEAAANYLETDIASLIMRDPARSEGIWSLWDRASIGQRQDIERLAEVIVSSKKAG